MAKILINDLFEELREENNRLVNDLIFSQKCVKFLENYRKLLINLNKYCVCDQNIAIKAKLNKLENNYKVFNQRIDRKQNLNEYLLNAKQTDHSIANKPIDEYIDTFDPIIDLSDYESSDRWEPTYSDHSIDSEVNSNVRSLKKKKKIKKEIIETLEYVCDWIGCGLQFKDETSLRAHERRHTNGSDSNEDINDTNDTNESQNDTNCQNIPEPSTDSKDCKMSSLKHLDMSVHYRRRHTTERRFQCRDCEKLFAKVRDLRNHKFYCKQTSIKRVNIKHNIPVLSVNKMVNYRRKHITDRPFKCKECNKSFAMIKDLKDHKRYAKHMFGSEEDEEFGSIDRNVSEIETKKIPCDWPDCTMTFRKPYEMRGHFRRKHINDRPYICNECGLGFAIQKYLNTHKKVVH